MDNPVLKLIPIFGVGNAKRLIVVPKLMRCGCDLGHIIPLKTKRCLRY